MNMCYAGWDTEVLPGPGPFFEWATMYHQVILVYHQVAQNARLKVNLYLALIYLFSVSFFL